MKRVVVTGIGVISPCGVNIKTFWENILAGKSSITAYKEFPDFPLKSRVKASVDFDYKDFSISDDEAARMGRETQFAVAATQMALEDAKINITNESKEKIGVCIGNAIADTPFTEQQFLKIKNSQNKSNSKTKSEPYKYLSVVDKNLYTKGMFSCISTEIAAKYNLKGNVFTMSTGCTNGIDAVGYAFETLNDDESHVDIMICGATEAPLGCITFSSFDAIGALSRRNEQPDKASSPFDKSRDGFVLAEGCGILILEEYEHAVNRGAQIYGEILSYSTGNNASHMTDLPSDGMPLIRIIKESLNKACVKPEQIDYINAHGSSTKQNDTFEITAYKQVFGNSLPKIPISSLKSVEGHPLAAASAIELAASCLVLRNNKIPPTANIQNPDPDFGADYVPEKFREKNVSTILKDASGFSGIHSALVMKKI